MLWTHVIEKNIRVGAKLKYGTMFWKDGTEKNHTQTPSHTRPLGSSPVDPGIEPKAEVA